MFCAIQIRWQEWGVKKPQERRRRNEELVLAGFVAHIEVGRLRKYPPFGELPEGQGQAERTLEMLSMMSWRLHEGIWCINFKGWAIAA